MILKLGRTTTFKKCVKKYRHKKDILEVLKNVVALLVNEEPLSEKYRGHELIGKYKGIRELHLKPDVLLLYVKNQGQKIILMAIGSHSEIF